MFFIVHDEAHYAPIKGSNADKLINNQNVCNAENVILLQVTATPYNLLTSNSRIPENNSFDMFKLLENNKTSSNYYGIEKFIEEANENNSVSSPCEAEGTLTDDREFE